MFALSSRNCSGDERYHLLSLCGMVSTHSAAGRMVLMNLANFSQYERELISERTRAAACKPCRAGARNAQRRWFA
jgi:DNA invertase Pin-like site-specific DNA recombinase